MRYEEIRDQIRTGDILACHGVATISKIIEATTCHHDPEAWSHVGLFVWVGQGLFLAQEYEGEGFGIYPASQLIAKFQAAGSSCSVGRAPKLVVDNSSAIFALIETYRTTPHLRPYGYGSLLRILVDKELHRDEDPAKVQAVCSIFDQQAWEKCGFTFARLFAPEDFKTVVEGIIPIDKAA